MLARGRLVVIKNTGIPTFRLLRCSPPQTHARGRGQTATRVDSVPDHHRLERPGHIGKCQSGYRALDPDNQCRESLHERHRNRFAILSPESNGGPEDDHGGTSAARQDHRPGLGHVSRAFGAIYGKSDSPAVL